MGNVSRVTFYPNFTNSSAPLSIMATSDINGKKLKTTSPAKPVAGVLKQFYRKVSWVTLYQTCLALSNKMVARDKRNRKKNSKTTSFRKPVDGFCHSFTGMFHWRLSMKID